MWIRNKNRQIINNLIEIIQNWRIKIVISWRHNCLKLSAIANRGAKKDFFDIYELMKTYSISDMFKFFSIKFPKTAHFHILKSLTYFVDAEPEFDPISLNNASWEQVKSTIEKNVTEYM